MQMWRSAILAVLGLFVSLNADARVIREGRFGAWNLAALIDDNAPNFIGCAAVAQYRDRTNLIFVVTGGYQWSMWLQNEAWTLEKGSRLNLNFTIDSDAPRPLNGVIASGKMVAFGLEDSEAVFNRFREGNVMVLRVLGKRFPFTLNGSYGALTSALRCVQRHNTELRGPNPFAAHETGDAGTAKASLRAEAVTVVAKSSCRVLERRRLPNPHRG